MIHESMINLMFVAIWVSRGAVLMLVMGGLGEGGEGAHKILTTTSFCMLYHTVTIKLEP